MFVRGASAVAKRVTGLAQNWQRGSHGLRLGRGRAAAALRATDGKHAVAGVGTSSAGRLFGHVGEHAGEGTQAEARCLLARTTDRDAGSEAVLAWLLGESGLLVGHGIAGLTGLLLLEHEETDEGGKGDEEDNANGDAGGSTCGNTGALTA